MVEVPPIDRCATDGPEHKTYACAAFDRPSKRAAAAASMAEKQDSRVALPAKKRGPRVPRVVLEPSPDEDSSLRTAMLILQMDTPHPSATGGDPSPCPFANDATTQPHMPMPESGVEISQPFRTGGAHQYLVSNLYISMN